jgi:hypothetical protein
MVTVFFGNRSYRSVGGGQRKIDRSMPIVAEAIQITHRRNSCLKSGARISDRSPTRFFTMRRRIFYEKSIRYNAPEQSGGGEWPMSNDPSLIEPIAAA